MQYNQIKQSNNEIFTVARKRIELMTSALYARPILKTAKEIYSSRRYFFFELLLSPWLFSKSAARWRGEMTSVNGENLQKMTKNFQDFQLPISLLITV